MYELLRTLIALAIGYVMGASMAMASAPASASESQWRKWSGYQTGEVIVCPHSVVEVDNLSYKGRDIGEWAHCDGPAYGRR